MTGRLNIYFECFYLDIKFMIIKGSSVNLMVPFGPFLKVAGHQPTLRASLDATKGFF